MRKIWAPQILDDWPKPWEILEYYNHDEKLLKFTTVDMANDAENPFFGEPEDTIERYPATNWKNRRYCC
jgi:hypothetical protein